MDKFANFPKAMPSEDERFGANQEPIFLGCDGPNEIDGPLIIYLPNTAKYGGKETNFSTFKRTYTQEETEKFMTNGDLPFENSCLNITAHALFSHNDGEFSKCTACAMMKRSYDRLNLKFDATCSACFEKYCYRQS